MDEFDPDWMWERARALLDRADLSATRFVAAGGVRPPAWEPPTDVFETPTEFWVLVALPGVDPRRVEVKLSGSKLRITADRPQPVALRGARVHRLEIPYGRFERCVSLPDGEYEMGSSRMGHGCAVLQIKKSTTQEGNR